MKFINPAPLQTYRLLGIQVPYMVIIERFVLGFFLPTFTLLIGVCYIYIVVNVSP